jgi:hypothetical protein
MTRTAAQLKNVIKHRTRKPEKVTMYGVVILTPTDEQITAVAKACLSKDGVDFLVMQYDATSKNLLIYATDEFASLSLSLMEWAPKITWEHTFKGLKAKREWKTLLNAILKEPGVKANNVWVMDWYMVP